MQRREFRNREIKDIDFRRSDATQEKEFPPLTNSAPQRPYESRDAEFRPNYRDNADRYDNGKDTSLPSQKYIFANREVDNNTERRFPREPARPEFRNQRTSEYPREPREYRNQKPEYPREPREYRNQKPEYPREHREPREYRNNNYQKPTSNYVPYKNEVSDRRSGKPQDKYNKKSFNKTEPVAPADIKVRTIPEFIENINEHVAHYKELNDANAREIVDYIKSLLIPMHIKFTFEHLSHLERAIKLRDDYKELICNPNVEFHNIETAADIPIRFRFILSTNRHKADFSLPLVQQSNGAMYSLGVYNDKLQCKLLAKPSNDFTNKYSNDIVDKLAEYNVYSIKDGTCIHIFYDAEFIEISNIIRDQPADKVEVEPAKTADVELSSAEKLEQITADINSDVVDADANKSIKVCKSYTKGAWVVASKNSFNINGLVWRGYEYQRVINHILSLYPDFDIKKLNKEITYNIGFKHPAFHPFHQPKEWNDEYFKYSPEEIKAEWEISAWIINDDTLSTFDHVGGIPVQQPYHDIESAKTDFEKTRTSLKNYCNHVYKTYMKDPEFVGKMPEVFLGLILRSKTGCDIIIESSLWLEIRKLIYQMPFINNKQLRDKQEQNFKNIIHIIMECYLDINKHRVFAQLFPQYYKYYNRYNSIVDAVVNKIHNDIASPNANYIMQKNKQEPATPTADMKIIQMLVEKLKPAITQKYTVAPSSRGRGRGRGGKPVNHRMPERLDANKVDKKVIKSIIMHARFTDLFYSAIYEPAVGSD